MSVLTPNRLAFLALANEYCHAVENARQADRADFVADMLRLLPRIYIAASDIPRPDFQQDPAYIARLSTRTITTRCACRWKCFLARTTLSLKCLSRT